MPKLKSYPCFLTPKNLNPHYPLFVFLPGMDGTGELLRCQTESLQESFDIRCLAIPSDDLTDWDTLSAQVVELIKKEIGKESQRSVYLCGESFGGCLALKVAVREPKLFDRIILVNPASSFSQRPWLRWGAQYLRLIPECFYRFSALAILPFFVTLARTASRERRELLEAMRSVPPHTVQWRISLLKDFRVDENHLRRLTQPVLLIAGGADRVLPSIAEAKRLASKLPDARIFVLKYSGHACLLETETQLYQILKAENFLAADVPQPATISNSN
ncbi:alpha/beta fold hydrolase [Oscillatoria salina]|uniref:alpha/beta fold hydrolase n=1 Tax=Oscillatoria salina TaxID=331517 RepID=UPI0013B6BC95|nr:alpha/beta hydrolase [Oscillatoria salina]MBZ8182911.1 alpha/beta fold hydrolase [Oscillatoria salina IIICB1]NET86582.1 alpha/beta fold hydrolase [Kamptonema sp. SIO1D9]